MSFGATGQILTEFNFYEACFWLVAGSIVLCLSRMVPHRFQLWSIVSGLNFIIFGITDIVELYTGGFLHTAIWLLYWKLIHVVGVIVSAVWYIQLRLKK